MLLLSIFASFSKYMKCKQIRNMEHMIEHETLPLKEEKNLLRQIKQLKQQREELLSNLGKQDQLQLSLDNENSIEEHFKVT